MSQPDKSRCIFTQQEKELFHSAPAPRLLSIDSYFLTEVEKTEKDPETGRRVKRRVQEYEYEPEMEQVYRYGEWICRHSEQKIERIFRYTDKQKGTESALS